MFLFNSRELRLDVDLHSHLVPGVDDGAKSMDDALQLLADFQSMGYKKIITTPHISETYYPNQPEQLQTAFASLCEEKEKKGLTIELELGAEYMVDAMLLENIKAGEELLSWHGYLLIETPFHNLPMIFEEVIFEVQSRNLIPVYAHPERYAYFAHEWDRLEDLRSRGVLLQVTAGSFVGFYGKEPARFARELLKRNMIDFIGSDVHATHHLNFLKKALRSKPLNRWEQTAFKNHELG